MLDTAILYLSPRSQYGPRSSIPIRSEHWGNGCPRISPCRTCRPQWGGRSSRTRHCWRRGKVCCLKGRGIVLRCSRRNSLLEWFSCIGRAKSVGDLTIEGNLVTGTNKLKVPVQMAVAGGRVGCSAIDETIWDCDSVTRACTETVVLATEAPFGLCSRNVLFFMCSAGAKWY